MTEPMIGELCSICGAPIPPGMKGQTCSYSCRAKLREARKTTEWRKPRAYPTEIVEAVRRMYVDEGMTVLEVQRALPRGFKAQRIIERHIPTRRVAAKRDQSREKNHAWHGDHADYDAVHARLYAWKGKASTYACIRCGEGAHDWSYNGDAPHERRDPSNNCPYTTDLTYYSPRCRTCHRRHDAAMRSKESDAHV